MPPCTIGWRTPNICVNLVCSIILSVDATIDSAGLLRGLEFGAGPR